MKVELLWKWGSLIAFCLQNAITPIVFRIATTETAARARASTAVILSVTEVIKFTASFFLLATEVGFSFFEAGRIVYRDWLQSPRDSLKLAVPAIVYALQNALLQWSSGHLPAALWQVTYQGKILVTATFSVVLLGKRIQRSQWLAITLMGAGIATVQLSGSRETKQVSMGNAAEQSPVAGFCMLLLACCCSGFASVYTEKVFKQVGTAATQKKKSVWLQNMQLASFTLPITFWGFAVEQMYPVEGGAARATFLRGFTTKTWILAVNNAVGGLLVALVIKHADNILRGFSSAIATVLASIIAVITLGFVLRVSFGFGALTVIGSTLLYGNIVKLPGEWWNSELVVCGSAKVATHVPVPTEETEELHDTGSPIPHADVVGNEETEELHDAGSPVPHAANEGEPDSPSHSESESCRATVTEPLDAAKTTGVQKEASE